VGDGASAGTAPPEDADLFDPSDARVIATARRVAQKDDLSPAEAAIDAVRRLAACAAALR
jgi:hypothetical protein